MRETTLSLFIMRESKIVVHNLSNLKLGLKHEFH